MLPLFRHGRDYYAGALMALLGSGVVAQGMTLRIGTLTNMGPGYFPIALGAILALLGLVIAATGSGTSDPADTLVLDVRGCAFIIAGTVAFIVLGEAFGFVAGTFSAVFLSALGDTKATLKGSLLLAAGMTLAGATVFTWLLSIPFQLFHWF